MFRGKLESSQHTGQVQLSPQVQFAHEQEQGPMLVGALVGNVNMI